MSVLAIGTITAKGSPTGITLTLSAGLSGGSGTGYVYKIYRGTTPNFAINSGSLIATASSMPYTDTSALLGVQYFYGVVGVDSAAATVYAVPPFLGTWVPDYVPNVTSQVEKQALNICFIGDSQTQGAYLSSSGTVNAPGLPYYIMQGAGRMFGPRTVFGTNQGHGGHTTTDWLPGGGDYTAMKTAMDALVAANPTAQSIFSIMLGPNDSASTLTDNGGIGASLPASTFQANLVSIATQLRIDYPGCKIVIHLSPFYSVNFQNAATYLQAGLAFLWSYRQATRQAVAVMAAANPGAVILGDELSFNYVAQRYSTFDLADNTSSDPGITGYIHQSGDLQADGLIPTQVLGEFHAMAMRPFLDDDYYASLGSAVASSASGVDYSIG